MSKTILAGLLLFGAVGTGCVFSTAAESVQGRAWVMKNTPFGSSFWHCDASAGEPTCTQVTNVAAGAPAAGGGAK
jgi:hypothetical protein